MPGSGLLLFIIGCEFDFIIGGLDFMPGVEAFALAPGLPSILRISSAEGIPGVGVAPGFSGLFIFDGSGMPGVGVAPLGTAPLEFTPGTFAGCWIGLAESPGGRFAGSRLTATGAALEAVALPALDMFAFVVFASPPHAIENIAVEPSIRIMTDLFMIFLALLRRSVLMWCGFDYSLHASLVNRFDLPKPLIYTYKFACRCHLNAT